MKKQLIRMLVFSMLLMCVFGVATSAQAKKKRYQYKIEVNKTRNVVNIYRKANVDGKGKWKPYKVFLCSTGYATPVGTFHLGEKMRWHTLMGPSYGQYCSRITGGFLFHSVWYYSTNKSSQSYVQYNRLGTTASHGCVRLTVRDAKWIYDNCPSGTKIRIYYSKKAGPLGKPKLKRVHGLRGWDPTDPDPANPYHPYSKKKPTIKGVKNITVKYGKKVKLLKNVVVRDSAGGEAKTQVKLKIKFKAIGGGSYKKVEKVDTKKPGVYKITITLKDYYGHKVSKTFKCIVKSKKKENKNTKGKDLPKPVPAPTMPPGMYDSPGQTAVPSPKTTPFVSETPMVSMQIYLSNIIEEESNNE